MWITFWRDRRKTLNTWEKIRNVDNVDNYVDNLIIASLNAGKWEMVWVWYDWKSDGWKKLII